MALGGSNISAAAIDELTADQIAEMSIADLYAIQDEIGEAETLWGKRKEALRFALDKRIGEKAAAQRLAAGKDTGVVHITDGDLSIECSLSKRVKWDQKKLAELHARITAAGDDPTVYMQAEYKIAEKAYAPWSDAIKKAFDPARTVTTDKAKYTISDPNEVKR